MPHLIGLSVPPSEDFHLKVIQGILEYVRREPSLRVATRGGEPYLAWEGLSKFRGDGLIAVAHTCHTARQLARLRCPAVIVSSQSRQDYLPSVAVDDAAIGRLAAQHLLQRRCERVACIYYPRWANNVARLEAFRQIIEQAGVAFTPIAVSFQHRVEHLETERPEVKIGALAQSLDKLTRPLSVFATHDEFAAAAVEALQSSGASLPYDALIVGHGNNPLICESCDPPISSISRPGELVGYEAAAALHRLVRGRELACRHLRLPPVDVVVRRSSDVMATRDQLVGEAIEQIRLRLNESFSVEKLAKLMSVSRSGLYKRFMAALGHTPADEIRRARLAKGATLLSTTDMQIPTVAFDSGYRSVGAFCRAFRRATGATPLEYRKRSRSRSNRPN